MRTTDDTTGRAAWRRAFAAIAFTALTAGCALIAPETDVPMPTEVVRAAPDAACTGVLLPGRWNRMGAFREQGFAEPAAEAGVPIALVAADAHVGYYRDRSLLPRLAADVVGPLLDGGSGPVWMIGTSLGGVGSIIYRKERPDEVAGLVLIAPYLGEALGEAGEGGVLDELREAGSLAAWDPVKPVAEDDFERRIWLGLREILASDTPVLLAYGTEDDLSPGHELLARELPPERVFRRPGGHDWPVWTALWSDVLASDELTCGAPPSGLETGAVEQPR